MHIVLTQYVLLQSTSNLVKYLVITQTWLLPNYFINHLHMYTYADNDRGELIF